MRAFMTGSREYGFPRPDSDYDLVIYCSEATIKLLRIASGCDNGTIRFGPLNIIALSNLERYTRWEKATEHCKVLAVTNRLSRDAAVEIFKAFGCSTYNLYD